MIRIFVTGGTFDKDYNELTGSLVFKDTHLPEMLRLGRNRACRCRSSGLRYVRPCESAATSGREHRRSNPRRNERHSHYALRAIEIVNAVR